MRALEDSVNRISIAKPQFMDFYLDMIMAKEESRLIS